MRERLERKDEGFTLIELMVVVLIIGILLAIAIPTFLGARKRAQDKQAQSNIRNALTAEKTFYTDNQAYTETAADLQAIEPSLVYTNAPTTAQAWNREVGVSLSVSGSTDAVCIGAKSKSGTVFLLFDIATGTDAGTYYAKDTSCPTNASAPSGWSKSGW